MKKNYYDFFLYVQSPGQSEDYMFVYFFFICTVPIGVGIEVWGGGA